MDIYQAEIFLDLHQAHHFGKKFLMLGDVECQFTYGEARRLLQKKKFASADLKASEVRMSHMEAARKKNYIHMQTWVKLLGISDYTDCDINGRAALNLDLNKPVPSSLHGQFDVVAQFGTLEHIFDVRSVMEQIGRMCKPGGYILHAAPVSGSVWIDHGFYQLSPRLFYDYYRQNHYEVLKGLIRIRHSLFKGGPFSFGKMQYEKGDCIEYGSPAWKKILERFKKTKWSNLMTRRFFDPELLSIYFLARKTPQVTYECCLQSEDDDAA